MLSEDERAKLQEWARRPKTAQRLALRARIVLNCAEGMVNRRVARQLGITDQTVCKWRERFRMARLEGLADEPRPGAPRQITDAEVEALITRTLETLPTQGTLARRERSLKPAAYPSLPSPASGGVFSTTSPGGDVSNCPRIRSL